MGTANELRLAFVEALRRRRERDPRLGGFIEGLSRTACLENAGAGGSVPDHATEYLSCVSDGLACDAALAPAVRSFAAGADWYCILEGAELDPVLVSGLLVGRPELPEDAGVRLGLFLIAPHVHYPLHQHAAEEIYFVASGQLELQHGLTGTPFVLDPGEYSVTPCHRLHALTTGAGPCLLLYAWTGEITEPAWWWAEDESGWHRTRWDREDNGRWHRLATEPVTQATLAEAGEQSIATFGAEPGPNSFDARLSIDDEHGG